jgi:Phage integrase, N-terminal SAM-like domain
MVYANADITKAGQAAEIIAFADYRQQATGSDPGLLVFDSQLTTYAILEELSGRGIRWLTLRQRGKTELARLEALPASAWRTAVIARSGRYRRPRLHEDMIKLKDISGKVRQIAVKNIGRDEPTLLISNDVTTPGKNLFARYAERMLVENELDAYIGGFHLDALTSGVPLNVDLDTTLPVAGQLYRLLALKLNRYSRATPSTLWRDFLDATGTLHITEDAVTCALNLRSHHPVLIDAGFFSRLSIVVGETRNNEEKMQDVAGYWDVEFYDFVSGSPGVVEGLVGFGDLHERAAGNGARHGTPVLVSSDGVADPRVNLFFRTGPMADAKPGTWRRYAYSLVVWLNFLLVLGRAWDRATVRDVEAFKHWRLTDQSNDGRVAPASFDADRAALKTFYTWAAARFGVPNPVPAVPGAARRRGYQADGFLQPGRVGDLRVGDHDDGNPVIGQQPLVDRRGERQAVHLRPERALVVHRRDIVLLRGQQAGSRGHVQAARSGKPGVVVDKAPFPPGDPR